MKKILALLLASVMILTAVSISVSAARRQAPVQKIMIGDATVVITLFYGDGETPCDGATIKLSRNDGGYQRTVYTNEEGDPVTIDGVPGGLYTIEAWRPHPDYGKQIGILLWGKVLNNNLQIIDGETNEFQFVLEGGLFQSTAVVLHSQPSSC